jgi:hypothetical protein
MLATQFRSAVAVLNATAKFFEQHPESWVQHFFASNHCGGELSPYDPEATCWCLTGRLIVEAAALGVKPGVALNALLAVAHARGAPSVMDYNDRSGCTVQDVADLCIYAAVKIEDEYYESEEFSIW